MSTVGWLQNEYRVPIEGSKDARMISVHGCPLCYNLWGLSDILNINYFIPVNFVSSVTGLNPIEVLIGATATETRDNYQTALMNYWAEYTNPSLNLTTGIGVDGFPFFNIYGEGAPQTVFFDAYKCSECIRIDSEQGELTNGTFFFKYTIVFECVPEVGDTIELGGLNRRIRAISEHRIDEEVVYIDKLFPQYRVTNQNIIGGHRNDLNLNKSDVFNQDIAPILRDYVSTPEPLATYGSVFTFAPKIIRDYRVTTYATLAGEDERKLGSFSDIFGDTFDMRIINACCQDKDIDMTAYSYLGLQTAPVKFLYDNTSDFSILCAGSKLHLYIDLVRDDNLLGNFSFYEVVVNGTALPDPYEALETGVHILEIDVPTSNTVDIVINRNTSGGAGGSEPVNFSQYSELISFKVLQSDNSQCCCNSGVYFLNKFGAFQKVRLQCNEDIQISIEKDYIEVCDSCSGQSMLLGDSAPADYFCYDCVNLTGKYITSAITTKVYNKLTHRHNNTEENREFIKRFVASTEYYLCREDCLELVDLNLSEFSIDERKSSVTIPFQFISSEIDSQLDSASSILSGDINSSTSTETPVPLITIGTLTNEGGNPACKGTTFIDNCFPISGMRSYDMSAILSVVNVPVPVQSGNSYWIISIEDTTTSTNYGGYAIANGADISQSTLSTTTDPNTLVGNEYMILSGGSALTWETIIKPYYSLGNTLSNGSTQFFDKLNWAKDQGRFTDISPNGVITGASSLKWSFTLVHNNETSNTEVVEMPILSSHLGAPWQGVIDDGTDKLIGYPKNIDDNTLANTNDNTLVRWNADRGWQINVSRQSFVPTNTFTINLTNQCIETNSEHELLNIFVDGTNYSVPVPTTLTHYYPDFEFFMNSALTDVNTVSGSTFTSTITHSIVTGFLSNDLDSIFEQWVLHPNHKHLQSMIVNITQEDDIRGTRNCIAASNQGSIVNYGRIWEYAFEDLYFIH